MVTRASTRRRWARICSWNWWLTAYIAGLLLLDERDADLFPNPNPVAGMPGRVRDIAGVGHQLLLAPSVGVLDHHQRLVGRNQVENLLKLRIRQVAPRHVDPP